MGPELFTIGGWVIAGCLGIVGMFSIQNRQRRQADDSVSTNLIQNLRTTADMQEKEIMRLRDKEVAYGKDVAHLQGQLKMLTEIMQGRDPAMQAFLKTAPDLIAIVRENNTLAKEQQVAMTDLTKKLGQLVTILTPKTA